MQVRKYRARRGNEGTMANTTRKSDNVSALNNGCPCNSTKAFSYVLDVLHRTRKEYYMQSARGSCSKRRYLHVWQTLPCRPTLHTQAYKAHPTLRMADPMKAKSPTFGASLQQAPTSSSVHLTPSALRLCVVVFLCRRPWHWFASWHRFASSSNARRLCWEVPPG